jgi:hypothetical protein
MDEDSCPLVLHRVKAFGSGWYFTLPPAPMVWPVGSAIVMEAADLGARFDGSRNQTLSAIVGASEQGGVRIPLALERVAGEDEMKPPRPRDHGLFAPGFGYPERGLNQNCGAYSFRTR